MKSSQIFLSMLFVFGTCLNAMERKQKSTIVQPQGGTEIAPQQTTAPAQQAYGKIHKELILSSDAREKMAELVIPLAKIEAIIRSGKKFLDAQNVGAIIYQERSTKAACKHITIVTRQEEVPDRIIIETLYRSETFGASPKWKTAGERHKDKVVIWD